MTELLRAERQSVGIYDERNFYLADVLVAGNEAKNPGEERLARMTYYSDLADALRAGVKRLAVRANANSVLSFIAALEAKTLAMSIAADKAAKALKP